MDLADPKWKGKLALSPTETDFQPIVTAVAARYGNAAAEKWLKAIRANAQGHIYPDNEVLVAQVNNGQALLGVINHYYWYRLKDELGAKKIHSAEHFFADGDPGYVIDVAGAGALASSKHQGEAQKFLAFLVSRRPARRSSATTRASSTRSGRASSPPSRSCRSRPCGPTRSR